MEIILKYNWVMFMAVTIGNAFILKYRSKKYIAQKSELEEGYKKYFKGILFYGNIPWIIMMVGNLSGITQSALEYLNPRTFNPMVLAFHFSIVVLWILAIRWIYFKNGAEFMENHPGLMKKSGFSGNTDVTAQQIKLFFPLMILGGVLGMVMMWMTGFSMPKI